MKARYLLGGGATLLTVLSIADDAAAANVDYPGEYLVYTNTDGRIFFDSSSLYLYYASSTPDGYLDTDIDSSGNLSYDSPAGNFTSSAIGTTGYAGLLVITNESGSAAKAAAVNSALSLGGSARDEMVWYGGFTSSSSTYPTCGPSYFPCGS